MEQITAEQLHSIIGHVSQRAVKHWLKVSELDHSASNTEQFYNLLLKLLNEKRLTVEDIQAAALEIEENGGKRIFLRKIEGVPYSLEDKTAFEKQVLTRGIRLAEQPVKSVKMPEKPTLNYVYWTPQQIKIKFSETHIEVDVDYENGKVINRPVTKFAIAIIDSLSCFVQIRLDPEGVVHSHKNPQSGISERKYYEEFYFSQFLAILGGQGLELYELSDVAKWLVEATPRVFR